MEGSKTSDYNLNIRTGHVAFFSPTPSIFKAGAYITPNHLSLEANVSDYMQLPLGSYFFHTCSITSPRPINTQ